MSRSATIRLGGATYRVELVDRVKATPLDAARRAVKIRKARGAKRPGAKPKGHRKGCRCFACR